MSNNICIRTKKVYIGGFIVLVVFVFYRSQEFEYLLRLLVIYQNISTFRATHCGSSKAERIGEEMKTLLKYVKNGVIIDPQEFKDDQSKSNSEQEDEKKNCNKNKDNRNHENDEEYSLPFKYVMFISLLECHFNLQFKSIVDAGNQLVDINHRLIHVKSQTPYNN